MAIGQKFGGRKKGSKNKFTLSAKDAFAKAFDAAGGAAALSEWAVDNRTEFYKLYAKLIPTEVSGVDGKPIAVAWPVPQTPLDQP